MSSSGASLPGRLKIKGVKDPVGGKKSKKSKHSKKKSTENTTTASVAVKEVAKKADDDAVYLRNEAGYTEAELRAMPLKSKKDKENAKKIAQKSYRERIEEFNKKLSSTSEHFDMPKIGPG